MKLFWTIVKIVLNHFIANIPSFSLKAPATRFVLSFNQKAFCFIDRESQRFLWLHWFNKWTQQVQNNCYFKNKIEFLLYNLEFYLFRCKPMDKHLLWIGWHIKDRCKTFFWKQPPEVFSRESVLLYERCFRPTTLLKRRLWHRCFPVDFAKFLRTPFLQNNSTRMLLHLLFLINDSKNSSSQSLTVLRLFFRRWKKLLKISHTTCSFFAN